MQVSGMDGHPILSEEMPESMTMGEVKGEIAKTDGAHKATIDLHLVDAKPAIEELGPLPDSFTVREVVDGTQELLRQAGAPVQLMMVLGNGADVEHPELVAIKDSDEQGIAAHTADPTKPCTTRRKPWPNWRRRRLQPRKCRMIKLGSKSARN